MCRDLRCPHIPGTRSFSKDAVHKKRNLLAASNVSYHSITYLVVTDATKHSNFLNMHLMGYIQRVRRFPKTGSTLSLLVLPVGLAVDVDSALSANHVAVLAKLLHRGSDLERSDRGDHLEGREERNGHGPESRRADARERTAYHGGQGKHWGASGRSGW